MSKHLVLLPGLTNTSEVWRPILEELPKTIKGQAVDIPADPNIKEIVDKLLPQLPNKFYLCGFSFGGYVALEILKRVPDRILGLILIGTTYKADSENQRKFRMKTIKRVENGKYNQMIDENIPFLFHSDSVMNEQILELYREDAKHYEENQYIAHLKAAMHRNDYTNTISSSSIPKLVLAGECDKIMPISNLEEQFSDLSNLNFIKILESGHMMILEKPSVIAEAMVNWIDQDK